MFSITIWLYAFIACTFLAPASAPLELQVLSSRGAQSSLTVYVVTNRAVTKTHVYPLTSFEAEVRKKSHSGWGEIRNPYIVDLVASPQKRYLACSVSRAGKQPPDVIRIYDLQTGNVVEEIVPPDTRCNFEWCGWEDEDTLRYNELSLVTQEGIEYDRRDIKTYSLTAHTTRLLQTQQARYGLDPVPAAYKQRADKAKEAFTALHLLPIDLGYYHSSGGGAVSEDGHFAVAETRNKGQNVYYLLEDEKQIGVLTWPKRVHVKRLKFVDDKLAVATEQNGVGTVQIWSLHPLKSIGLVKGDLLVD